MIGKLTQDSLLTRPLLAKALGVSVQEVQRRLRVGSLVPHSHRGTEPVFTYGQLEEQRMLTRKRTASGGAPTGPAAVEYTGEDASVVFACLVEKMSLSEIVVKHKIHPSIVMAASRAYAGLQGGVFLSSEELKAFERMPLDGEFPVQQGSQLVDMVESALRENACESCKRKTRKVCLACARNLARKGKHAAPTAAASDDVVEDD